MAWTLDGNIRHRPIFADFIRRVTLKFIYDFITKTELHALSDNFIYLIWWVINIEKTTEKPKATIYSISFLVLSLSHICFDGSNLNLSKQENDIAIDFEKDAFATRAEINDINSEPDK